MDKKLEREIINKYISMRKLIEQEGHWVSQNGMHFCLFHVNENTKSAKLFDNDGGGQVFCFSEYRQYTPYDYYTILHPEFNVTDLAQALFDRLPPEEQKNLQNSLNTESNYVEIPYKSSLVEFKEGKRTYEYLLKGINESIPRDDLSDMVEKLYNLNSVPKFKNDNKYLYYMNNYETSYKLISSYATLMNMKNLPEFVVQHLSSVGDCVIIPNIIDNRVMSLTFRSMNSNKKFLKYGEFSALMYGLGSMSKEFKYGTPIIITEGNLDCDFIKEIYPNTLAVLTASLTTNHIEILTHLTNRVILAFDNDESGERGYYTALKKLEGIKVSKFQHNPSLKDFGDLLDMKKNNSLDYEVIYHSYKTQIRLLTGE